MGIVLPGSGDSAGGNIIVPGGRRSDQPPGPTTRYPIHNQDLFPKIKKSQEQGYLNHHRNATHVVLCGNTGLVACLCCGQSFVCETEEQRPLFDAFLAEHVSCRPADETGAVGVVLVAD